MSLDSKRERRVVRTGLDEISTLPEDDIFLLAYLLVEKLDELDGEDFFGTEGWRRYMFGVDS